MSFNTKKLDDSIEKAVTIFNERYPNISRDLINIEVRFFHDGSRQLIVNNKVDVDDCLIYDNDMHSKEGSYFVSDQMKS